MLYTMTAKTLPGLEGVLAEELKNLGAASIKNQSLAVGFSGDEELLYSANLHLRSALRVLVAVREFSANRTEQIYAEALEVPWETWLKPAGSLAVDAVVSSSTFTHGSYCALKVKDAVCDRFVKKFGRRPDVDTDSPDLRINLRIHKEECALSLDSSGESLHRRGYRTEKIEAPLSEVLAAGILLLSGWDMQSPLYDPMCGSGTFLAEAGLMSAGIPCGSLRKKFGFMSWKTHTPELWKKVKTCAESLRRQPAGGITGSDSDPNAVKIAHANLLRAGLGDIPVSRSVFENSSPPPGKGLLVMNPPYGKRMRREDLNSRTHEPEAPQTDEIRELYTRIGDTLKRSYTGWTAWLFSANMDAVKHIGLRPFRRIPLRNGPLECRLVGIKMF